MKLDAILTLIQTDPIQLLETFRILWMEGLVLQFKLFLDHSMNIGSARDLQNIMAVKGMKRGEQQKLLEAFGLPDSSGHSEISNQPSTNPFESDSNETMLSGSNQGQEEVKNREEEEEEKSLFERAQISFKSSINTAPLKNMMQRENSDNRSNTSAEEDEDEEEESVRKRILGSMKNLFD